MFIDIEVRLVYALLPVKYLSFVTPKLSMVKHGRQVKYLFIFAVRKIFRNKISHMNLKLIEAGYDSFFPAVELYIKYVSTDDQVQTFIYYLPSLITFTIRVYLNGRSI